MSFTKHAQAVVAIGRVTVQPPEVGAVPTLIVKAAVPLLLAMLAADPPHPAAAIVGTAMKIKGLGLAAMVPLLPVGKEKAQKLPQVEMTVVLALPFPKTKSWPWMKVAGTFALLTNRPEAVKL